MSTFPVTFVLPVHNGERHLVDVLEAILQESQGRDVEILAIDDGSTDGSRAILEKFEPRGVRCIDGPRQGAAAALNLGLRRATHAFVCQVDQDVVLHPGWLSRLLAALTADEGAAAAQGWFVRGGRGIWAAVMGLDLEARYATLSPGPVNHVCTGNTVYRTEALRSIGGFDESMGYGYDNDVSYRLASTGHRLLFVPDAKSTHHWRESFSGYLAQQYGVGYGRLDVIAKHPRRVGGDQVSGLRMILHVPLVLAALLSFSAGLVVRGSSWLLSLAFLAPAFLERCDAGFRAAIRFRAPAALLFPFVHLIRDLAWVAALGVWSLRRVLGRPRLPSHSMATSPRSSR